MSNVGTLVCQKLIGAQGSGTVGLHCYTCFNAKMKNLECYLNVLNVSLSRYI